MLQASSHLHSGADTLNEFTEKRRSGPHIFVHDCLGGTNRCDQPAHKRPACCSASQPGGLPMAAVNLLNKNTNNQYICLRMQARCLLVHPYSKPPWLPGPRTEPFLRASDVPSALKVLSDSHCIPQHLPLLASHTSKALTRQGPRCMPEGRRSARGSRGCAGAGR